MLKPLQLKKKDNYLAVEPRELGQGGRGRGNTTHRI